MGNGASHAGGLPYPRPHLFAVKGRSMREKVSILIPCYNSERFIERSIQSAIAQTYPLIELVISDNASTDGTFRIASELAAGKSNVILNRNPRNLGPVCNWRKCLEMSTGEYSALLFSDDWYEPGFIAAASVFLEDPEIGFAYSPVRAVSPDGAGNTVSYRLPTFGKLPSELFLSDQMYLNPQKTPLSPCCALFRRGDLQKSLSEDIPDRFNAGYLRHGAGPDVLTYLKIAASYRYFAHIPEPLVNFTSHEKNLSAQTGIRLAYALAKAEFAGRMCPSGIVDSRRFRTAHFWRLLSVGKPGLYKASMGWDKRAWDIGLTEILLYAIRHVARR